MLPSLPPPPLPPSFPQATFVHGTHYCFTVGKDRLLKYWDLDRHEMLMEMPGHHAEVWALAVSAYGDFVITGALRMGAGQHDALHLLPMHTLVRRMV